jgi:hypothetical protein
MMGNFVVDAGERSRAGRLSRRTALSGTASMLWPDSFRVSHPGLTRSRATHYAITDRWFLISFR